MTIDAVGGVWRYGMDLAASLRPRGFEFLFVGLGPKPSDRQQREAAELGHLRWLDAPLDWMVENEDELSRVGPQIADLARAEAVDLLHLNLPSQAAAIDTDIPVIVMSHSCVVTWFAGVRGEAVPMDWQWHHAINRCGLNRADLALAPSRSHARTLEETYGAIDRLHVVYNASRSEETAEPKDAIVCAAARWWDDGKNGGVLDEAAAFTAWPIMMAGPNTGPDGETVPIRYAERLGELPHADVMALMRRSSVFVSPSVYEPFGLAALEAARAHNALVLADIPTYRELWDGAALFTDPRDAKALAAAVDCLCGDDDLRTQLADKASERSRRFDLRSQAEAMAGLYGGLLRRTLTFSAAELA
ncbi:glycosyltransferase family 4 protein [Neorhizobium sp. LjRoot104]|uniref:glycosyltransferase family 4 protein n=1 Tax=Neorhizobium sp. LjRoot104 TaxID=3342254 RepID=UPI003ECF2B5D